MIPIPLSLVGFWGKIKWGVIAAVAIVALLSAYMYGRGSCSRAALKAMEQEIEKVQRESEQAVKKAAKDARALALIERTKDDIRKEADTVTSDDACPLDDDQLRILREVQKQTTNK